MSADKLTRIAIVDKEKCKPKRCAQECKKSCPVVRMGKLCIEVSRKDKIAYLSETLCIGCGICVKKCPFEAISIINLPKNLDKQTTHRYGPNSFKLHRLPQPRAGQVLGLVGENGSGKSTSLKVLSGKLKPNLGDYADPPDWSEILTYFRGNELQNYFTRILEDDIKCVIKPQYVDHIPKAVRGTVGEVLAAKDEKGIHLELAEELSLDHLFERDIGALSGGELQRFACAVVCGQDASVYMVDEPSSYLDVRQRITMSRVIRSMLTDSTYVIVVEHDLSILDYLSDYICMLYGKPGVYGVVTMPFSVREGINIFLSGHLPTENLRFRDEALNFKITETAEDDEISDRRFRAYNYPSMTKSFGDQFVLHVEEGAFTDSEIVVALGQNGCGKTTFMRLVAGLQQPDDESVDIPELNVSYKPQKISPRFKGTVRQLLFKKIRTSFHNPAFQAEVMKPLQIEEVLDRKVLNLSGGELQRVALCLCLGNPADIYLIDEPSAMLDAAQRVSIAKAIKRFIMHSKKAAFIVEHDMIMSTYLADRIIHFSGEPGCECTATAPQSLLSGMNAFLTDIGVTFRKDPESGRARINKENSVKHNEQMASGDLFYLNDN